jgi:hypothetical protein
MFVEHWFLIGEGWKVYGDDKFVWGALVDDSGQSYYVLASERMVDEGIFRKASQIFSDDYSGTLCFGG